MIFAHLAGKDGLNEEAIDLAEKIWHSLGIFSFKVPCSGEKQCGRSRPQNFWTQAGAVGFLSPESLTDFLDANKHLIEQD